MNAPQLRRLALPMVLAFAIVAAACGDSDDRSTTPPGDTPGEDDPIPVEPDGGIGDTPGEEDPIPVEPDGGIGDTPLGAVPFFGGNDDQCPSTTLTNDASDRELLEVGIDCLFAEYDSGTPVVWDVQIPTVEGDPIFHRYAYDGDRVTIVIDSRLDKFGSGEVLARSCAGIERAELIPEGIDCDRIDHSGFPEAA